MADCLFCKIARGELSTDFLVETDQAVAFRCLLYTSRCV